MQTDFNKMNPVGTRRFMTIHRLRKKFQETNGNNKGILDYPDVLHEDIAHAHNNDGTLSESIVEFDGSNMNGAQTVMRSIILHYIKNIPDIKNWELKLLVLSCHTNYAKLPNYKKGTAERKLIELVNIPGSQLLEPLEPLPVADWW